MAVCQLQLHDAGFEYHDFDQWLDNYERLNEEGIRPFLNLDHGMTMSMYYQDSEGNGVWRCRFMPSETG